MTCTATFYVVSEDWRVEFVRRLATSDAAASLASRLINFDGSGHSVNKAILHFISNDPDLEFGEILDEHSFKFDSQSAAALTKYLSVHAPTGESVQALSSAIAFLRESLASVGQNDVGILYLSF